MGRGCSSSCTKREAPKRSSARGPLFTVSHNGIASGRCSRRRICAPTVALSRKSHSHGDQDRPRNLCEEGLSLWVSPQKYRGWCHGYTGAGVTDIQGLVSRFTFSGAWREKKRAKIQGLVSHLDENDEISPPKYRDTGHTSPKMLKNEPPKGAQNTPIQGLVSRIYRGWCHGYTGAGVTVG
jgi:hypothetical protein